MSEGLAVFESDVGTCGLAWSELGIDRIQLPEADAKATMARLIERSGGRKTTPPPRPVARVIGRLQRHLQGGADDLRDVEVDLAFASPFARKVYAALRQIKPGKTTTYAELAKRAGSPAAARAVGRAVATNPLPLIVPCHRVLATNGLGGFSAHDGSALKVQILYREGVVLEPEHAAGMKRLAKTDAILGKIIKRVGAYTPHLGRKESAYDALVTSILHQQISMRAAATISARLRGLGQRDEYPDAEAMRRLTPARLASVGVSRQKAGYLKDLARHVVLGSVRLDQLPRMSDEQVIEELTQIKGIGRWSAQMVLIFHLGRLDVLPVDDLGLRVAIERAYRMPAPVARALIEEMGEKWRPYRSMATWALWQSLKV